MSFYLPKKIKVSDLAKAFFFGDTDTIRQDCFENLYQANNQSRTDFILIKSRILDFIYRICNLTSPITEVFDFALMFNYDETVVISTLNEMLRRSRPLLWSEDGFKIENPKSKARIMVTPIGKGYYERFFGEYFYDEVCIAAGPKTNVTPRAVYDFHTKLTDQDLKEIQDFSKKYGSILYRSIYFDDMPGMSFLHWQKLQVGFKWRDNYASDQIVFDPKREEWLRAQIVARVGDKWSEPI